MKSVRRLLVKVSTKVPAGIAGFDEITGGGLLRGLTTLLREQARQLRITPVLILRAQLRNKS